MGRHSTGGDAAQQRISDEAAAYNASKRRWVPRPPRGRVAEHIDTVTARELVEVFLKMTHTDRQQVKRKFVISWRTISDTDFFQLIRQTNAQQALASIITPGKTYMTVTKRPVL